MNKNTQATINELIAGSVGGAAQVLVGQPLDTVKTRAQVAPSTPFLSFRDQFLTETHRGYVCKCTWQLLKEYDVQPKQTGPMDILKQTIRKEGFFALYKGNSRRTKGHKTFNTRYRDGQPSVRYCRREFPPIRVIRHIQAYHLSIPNTLPQGDSSGGSHGRHCQRCSRQPRCVYHSPCKGVTNDSVHYSRDVQGAYARAVRSGNRQTAFCSRPRDVEGLGLSEGDHERLLGAFSLYCFSPHAGSPE